MFGRNDLGKVLDWISIAVRETEEGTSSASERTQAPGRTKSKAVDSTS